MPETPPTVPRRIDVFFYGLFMDADLLRSKGVNPVNVRMASVPGFGLQIGQRASLAPAANSRAFGMLMQLTHDEIDQLYSDPSVRTYRPEAISAELDDGSRVSALCFNLPVAPSPKESNPEYAAKLRDLGHRLGFPSDYTDRIR